MYKHKEQGAESGLTWFLNSAHCWADRMGEMMIGKEREGRGGRWGKRRDGDGRVGAVTCGQVVCWASCCASPTPPYRSVCFLFEVNQHTPRRNIRLQAAHCSRPKPAQAQLYTSPPTHLLLRLF